MRKLYNHGVYGGTTATVALLHGLELFIANVGDSRCVLVALQW